MSVNAVETPVLTVSQITSSIKQLLETRFQSFLLQGEISNFKQQASGHLYFSLKDERAQISAVMFRGNTIGLKPLPKEGDQVIVRGELSVYEPRGNYQMIVRELSYVGIGALLLKLEKLKQKLSLMGFFAPERKKPLPKHPKRIGVVTSPTGAVIQDILNVLTRRHSGFHLILNPVKVQGEGAAQEIAQAIEQFNEHNLVDVMIIGRGGGSIEDLFAFSEEVVAQAIYASKIPIISAVGHETDFSISDMVADKRAPTPSAAAEIVIAEKMQLLEFLHSSQKRLGQTLTHLITQNKIRLDAVKRHPQIRSPYTFLGQYLQKVDDMRQSMTKGLMAVVTTKRMQLKVLDRQLACQKPELQLQQMRQRLAQFKKTVDDHIQATLRRNKERLGYLVGHLKGIDPKVLLQKGYSLLFSEKDGSLILSTSELQPDQILSAHLADGQAKLVVKEILPNE